ncbi:MAG: aminotransferase class I/II-fold pyridoxal phosphate-dependent enzyme [Bianqueaceae bacterium]
MKEEEFRPIFSAAPYIKNGTLCLLCNPNNPTGQLLLGSELRPFLDELQRKGAYLMVDECFIEFSRQSLAQSMVEAVPSHPNLMVVRAATKFFGMPGLRLGYGITSNTAWAQELEAQMEPWHINAAAVVASRCIFQDLSYMEKTRRWFETERPTFLSGLLQWDSVHVYPGHACFFLLRAVDTARAEDIYTELLQEGILIRRAEGFENLSARHFRVALKDARSNAHFIRTIQKRGL